MTKDIIFYGGASWIITSITGFYGGLVFLILIIIASLYESRKNY